MVFWKKKVTDPDSAWKLQNKEQKENPLYRFINLQKEGRLVNVFKENGKDALENIISSELESFLYQSGEGNTITRVEFARWKDRYIAKMNVS